MSMRSVILADFSCFDKNFNLDIYSNSKAHTPGK